MIAELIRLVLSNIPLLMFVAALLIPTIRGGPQRTAEGYLSWLLLLAVGIDALWAGLFHVFAPHMAAGFIGWQVSPFQFEVGVADIALGLVAVVSFRQPFPFKSAVVLYAILFYVGVTIGHVREFLGAGNEAPGNFGMLLLLTVVRVALLAGLWSAARRGAAVRA